MKSVKELKKELAEGTFARKLAWLYCCGEESTARYADRYVHVLNGF